MPPPRLRGYPSFSPSFVSFFRFLIPAVSEIKPALLILGNSFFSVSMGISSPSLISARVGAGSPLSAWISAYSTMSFSVAVSPRIQHHF